MTHDRLVQAAYEVFGKSGYSGTSILDITNDIDVNRATFYNHFSGKSDIIVAAAEHMMFNDAFPYWASLDDALLTGTRKSITKWLAQSRAFWTRNSGFLSAWTEAAASDAAVQTAREKTFDLVGSWLPRYKASFSSAEEWEHALVMVQILTYQLKDVFADIGLTSSTTYDPKRILSVVSDIWCRSLRIDPAPADRSS
jgi:AcrR family transcriptional regulator